MGIGNGSIKRSQCQCFVVAVSATATATTADYGVVVDDDGDGDASQQLSLFHIKTCNFTLYHDVQFLLLLLFLFSSCINRAT